MLANAYITSENLYHFDICSLEQTYIKDTLFDHYVQ